MSTSPLPVVMFLPAIPYDLSSSLVTRTLEKRGIMVALSIRSAPPGIGLERGCETATSNSAAIGGRYLLGNEGMEERPTGKKRGFTGRWKERNVRMTRAVEE